MSDGHRWFDRLDAQELGNITPRCLGVNSTRQKGNTMKVEFKFAIGESVCRRAGLEEARLLHDAIPRVFTVVELITIVSDGGSRRLYRLCDGSLAPETALVSVTGSDVLCVAEMCNEHRRRKSTESTM